MKTRNKRNIAIGNKGIDIAIKRLADIGITAHKDKGTWGQPDLYAEHNGANIHIEVKSACLLKREDGKARLNSITISGPQLTALREAEDKGIFAIFMLVLRTQRRNIVKFFFPNDIHKPCELPLTKALDIAIPIKYLPTFLNSLR